eukprot:2414341-Rhodomonas_salina.1
MHSPSLSLLRSLSLSLSLSLALGVCTARRRSGGRRSSGARRWPRSRCPHLLPPALSSPPLPLTSLSSLVPMLAGLLLLCGALACVQRGGVRGRGGGDPPILAPPPSQPPPALLHRCRE